MNGVHLAEALLNVLPVAQSLNSFIRHADVVKMGNFTMMTSLLSNDPQKGTFKSPLFYTFKLFSTNCRGNAIDTYVACDTFSAGKYKAIPYLDVSTVYSKEKGSVIINVINRHKDKGITTEIINQSGNFSGKPSVTEVTAAILVKHSVLTNKKSICLYQKMQLQRVIKLFIHFHPILLHRSSSK